MNLREIENLLDDADVEYSLDNSHGTVVVVLPGEKRLKTYVLFIPQQEGFRVEAFVSRAPEQNQESVYKMLLQHNRKSFGVHYTLDRAGDIYIVGQFPESTTPDDVQIILGQILELADGDFNKILEQGFEDSIRKEWLWRLTRGEATFNLEAFEHLKPSQEELATAQKEWDSKQADTPESS